MHPEYLTRGPQGEGWYIFREDGSIALESRYPSEEAAWAEVARRAALAERRLPTTP